jgi:hypothetical protein
MGVTWNADGQTVTFTVDDDPSPARLLVGYGDGAVETVTGTTFTHQYSVAGPFMAQVQAYDEHGRRLWHTPVAVEVAAQEAFASEPEPESASATEAEAFDPAGHTVADVVAWVDAHPDQGQAVYDAELDGKARTTLLTALEERGAAP